MTHDEMCPLGYALDHLEQHDEECGWDPDNCTHYCQCVLFRKVRDAQREQDAGIVERLKWTMDPFDEAAKAIREATQ